MFVVAAAAMLAGSEIAAPPQQPRAASAPAPGVQRERATVRPPELSGEVRERAAQLVAQGERYLAQGKVGGARLFFRQAADAGLALGAIRLAATYDPGELARLDAHGIVADAAEARKWYERARELGAAEAEERLARLGAR